MDEGARPSRRRDAVFITALLGLSVFRSGFGALPTHRFYATTFVDALPDVPRVIPRNQWVLWSPLGPIVSRIIGMHSTRGFLFLHVLVVLAGLAVLVFSVRKQYGSIAMRVVLVAFVALPVSVVLQAWFGSYDAWVFLLSTTIVVTGSWTVAAVAGFGLALANFEQGAFIVAMLVIVAVAGLHGSWRRYACVVAGLAAGRIALGIWLHHNGVRYGRLDYQRQRSLDYWLTTARRSWVLLLLSLVGAAVLMVWCVVSGGRRQSYVLLIVLLGALAPMVLTADETRVYALATWPPLLALLLSETARDPERIRRAISPTIALAAIVPGWFVWVGHPHLADYHWIRIFWRH